MDSDALFVVLDNTRTAFDVIRDLTHEAISEVDQTDRETPGAYYAVIGESVQDYLREVGERDIASGTVVALIYETLVNHLDRYEIGKHYYQKFDIEGA
ncbi:hypothetical protein AB0K16_22190 [Nonomuraea jabiensis]|uniref:hypothetical protein n=1 Tax=Nonomuraea jabiensis TaxID=882448 RepID=UPI00343C4428